MEDELPEPTVVSLQRSDRLKTVHDFKTLAEKVAKSTIYHKNFYHPELRLRFGFIDRTKRIDMVFPYAQIGESEARVQLYVDTPRTHYDLDICIAKAKVFKELGEKYVYLESDTTLYDALSQLGVA